MKLQTTPFSKWIWTQAPTAALHGNVRNWGNGIIPHHLGPKHFVIIHSQSRAVKHSAAIPGEISRSSKWSSLHGFQSWKPHIGTRHTFPSITTKAHWSCCTIFIQKQTHLKSLLSTPSSKCPQEQTYIQTWASWASSPCGHRHRAEGKWTGRPSRCPCQCCLGSWEITKHHNAKKLCLLLQQQHRL